MRKWRKSWSNSYIVMNIIKLCRSYIRVCKAFFEIAQHENVANYDLFDIFVGNFIDCSQRPTPGKTQLVGYVLAIRRIISDGGTLGKYENTARSERAEVGNLIIGPRIIVRSVGDFKIMVSYYSKGDGMIYYDVKYKLKKPERSPAFAHAHFRMPTKEDAKKVAIRLANAGLGISEMYFALNVMLLGGLMYADNVTGIGFIDDIWATGLELTGGYLWLDGWHKIMDSLTFCGG